jgi:hypothetical protein
VVVARLKPVGRAGVTEQPVITPPVLEGVWVVMATPLVATSELGLKAMTGAASLTVMERLAAEEPPEFEAVMV